MTTPRNPDRLIRTYLQEDQAPGQPEVPDHVYNAIRDGIEQTRQRAVIGSMGVPDMNKFLAIGLGAAAVVVALLVGSNLMGSSSPAPAAHHRHRRSPPKPRHPSRRLRSRMTLAPSPKGRYVGSPVASAAVRVRIDTSPSRLIRLATGFTTFTNVDEAWPWP